jgi:hypothetical protein
MSVSFWDVNRKIPFNKLLKDIKSGKYKGIKFGSNGGTYFTVMTGGIQIEIDQDGLLSVGNGNAKRKGYPTGIADRFDVNLPGFNRGGAEALDKFTSVLTKQYGSKFMSDFEMESPEREWTRYTEVKSNIHPNEKPLPKNPFAGCGTIEYSKKYPKGKCMDIPINRPQSVFRNVFGRK